ncbi:N-6 DNA methylase [Clostridium sp. ZS2-4]|uniref:N-6 DNA methylase n=1 Tax=Clostridium sp. ZS2-4 TaxID=2987703 RepID=UPI00227A3216|nr:N-6 DNA methylase [Clostridium sp. ZS2-4]MCY6353670.1 N-6 DNA methylase [Clostridium sp. ZS2-4]
MNIINKYNNTKLFSSTLKAYDLFKGHAPREEGCLLTLGAFFIKWINDSKNRYDWVISPETSWDYIKQKKDNLPQTLKCIGKKLEKDNPILKGIFTSLCFNYIDLLELSYWHEIINLYDIFDFTPDNSEEVITGPFIESILEQLNEEFSFYGIISPQSLKLLISKLFKINEGMSIGDITLGSAGFLAQTSKEAKSKKLNISNINFYGQDINFRISLIAKLNLFLHGITNFDITVEDTLKFPKLDSNNKVVEFDIILSNLPLGMRWSEEVSHDRFNRFKYGLPDKRYADWLFIQSAIASLKPKGKAALVVNKGTLMRSYEKEIRTRIIEDDLIEAIISLPENLYRGTSIPIDILIINKDKPIYRKNKILFIDASKEYEKKEKGKNILNEEQLNHILNTYHSEIEEKDYSKYIDYKEIEQKDFRLDSVEYVKENDLKISHCKMIQLGKIDNLKIKRGLQISKKDLEVVSDNTVATHYFLKISDIQDGKIEFNERIIAKSEKWVDSFGLKPKDIVISGRGKLVKVAVYEEYMPPAIISGNLMYIRLNPKKYDVDFLNIYLNSPLGSQLLKDIQFGSSIVALNPSRMKEVLVPDIPLEEQQRLVCKFKDNERIYQESIDKATEIYDKNVKSIYEKIGIIEK